MTTTQKGFTLIEILITVAILGVLSLVVAYLVQFSSSVTRNAISQSGKTSLEQVIRTTVQKADTCTAALVSTTFNPPLAPNPGVTNLTMNIASGPAVLTIQQNATLPSYKVRIDNEGFRLVVAAGATPEISGSINIWTGVLELRTLKQSDNEVGGRQMASSVLTAIRVRVNNSGQIVGCVGPDSYVCPDGQVQTGPYSSQCMTPEAMFAGMCPADAYPVSNGAGGLNCRTASQLVGGLCPVNQVAVSNGVGGITCRTMAFGCFGTCNTEGASIWDGAIERILECHSGCWAVTVNTYLCLPPSSLYKGDDEWMNFHQDSSMRGVLGRPCQGHMISGNDGSSMDGNGNVYFDDQMWTCRTDQHCIAAPPP